MATDPADPAARRPTAAPNREDPAGRSPIVAPVRRTSRQTVFHLAPANRINGLGINGLGISGLRVPITRGPRVAVNRFINVPMAPPAKVSVATGNVTISARASRMVRGRVPTRRKAPSGCMVITRSPPPWPTSSAACAA